MELSLREANEPFILSLPCQVTHTNELQNDDVRRLWAYRKRIVILEGMIFNPHTIPWPLFYLSHGITVNWSTVTTTLNLTRDQYLVRRLSNSISILYDLPELWWTFGRNSKFVPSFYSISIHLSSEVIPILLERVFRSQTEPFEKEKGRLLERLISLYLTLPLPIQGLGFGH